MLKKIICITILMLTLAISSIIIPTSYAKYIKNLNGSSNLDIAKWDIIINDKDINEEFVFNLFETVNDSTIKNDIKAIAPGIGGNITLNIENSSDVKAQFTINIEETENKNNIPIVYSLEENGEYKKLSELSMANNEEISVGEIKKVILYWKWDFYKDEDQNQIDNELGQNGEATLKLSINIKVNQKIS